MARKGYRSVECDSETGELTIHFWAGPGYCYKNVPADVAKSLVDADWDADGPEFVEFARRIRAMEFAFDMVPE